MSIKEEKPEKDQPGFKPQMIETPWPTEDRSGGGVIIFIPNKAPHGWPAMPPQSDDIGRSNLP